ncbi:hypothetical protein GCM10022406_27540 [Hymenobacter algoricola]|uniref:Uncharacterized protein n=2 Tax=Hymenobacter algoricola TaxID=486267 RepID=A0ABP7NDX0_9BACT
MRTLSDKVCVDADEFKQEALELYKWSSEYDFEWMYLNGSKSGNVCMFFLKPNRSGTGVNKKRIKLFGENAESTEGGLRSLNRMIAIDDFLNNSESSNA